MSKEAYINISVQAFGGLISMMIIIFMGIYRKTNSHTDRLYIQFLFCNTILQLCNILSWALDGVPGNLIRILSLIANFFMYTCTYLLIGTFTNYFNGYLIEKGGNYQKAVRITWKLIGIAILVMIIAQWNHMYYSLGPNNIYQRGSKYWLSIVMGIPCMLPCFWILFHTRKRLKPREWCLFLAYLALPILGAISHIFVWGILSLHIMTTAIVVSIYIFIQAEHAHTISEQTLALERNRTAIMLSQIQPHFLYNSLVAIKQLCDIDPAKASTALQHFAYFLRGNLYSISDPHLVPFDKELGHVKDYLYLEQTRFEESLHIEWDIQFTDFLLPSLTLQPLVENAVHHGITKKEGGGTLTIQSFATRDAIVIIVKDNGIGFWPTLPQNQTRPHIELENVKTRLQAQCHGSLVIRSTSNVGTEIKITLPR